MKKIITTCILFSAFIIMGFSVYGLALPIIKTSTKKEKVSNGVVVLELFTSQGCSSCPPADAVLAKYVQENNPNIIPLAFHVDYWNYIGWKDPFSKAQYSDRQREYAQSFNSNGVYTPQLVINGKQELVGSKENAIATIVNKELLVATTALLTIHSTAVLGSQLLVKFTAVGTNKESKVNLALVKKKEFTKIKRGENNGLEQTSFNIVYDFATVAFHDAVASEATLNFQSQWNPADFMVVVYVQNKNTGAIEGASKSEVNL